VTKEERARKRHEKNARLQSLPGSAARNPLVSEVMRQLGRRGGKVRAAQLTSEDWAALGRAGGAARALALTPERRQEIARLAAKAPRKARQKLPAAD
jgi:hypothetical protein